MTDWIDDFPFSQPDLFLIPVEHLTRAGIQAPFRDRLTERANLPAGWVDLFDEAFALYWERTADLSARTSMYWFPPRVQHVAIALDPLRVRPYFQPFHKSAWLLYASDFDPAESNAEFGAYQLISAERVGLHQQLVPAFVGNLSYWLVRGDEEVAAFQAASHTSTRPDAAAYRALADALPWLRELHHEVLRPLEATVVEPHVTVPGTGLVLPRSAQADLDALVQVSVRALQGTIDRHHAAHATRNGNHAEEVCEWVRDEAPRVVITGEENQLLWDPERPAEVGALRDHLHRIPEGAAGSLRADLAVCGARSEQFVRSLTRPEELPAPDPRSADQNGLCYMHLERRELAYRPREVTSERLRVPSPAFERWMLGARAIHEWGHLATEAGWIPVPEHRRVEHEALLEETAAHFDELVAAAPEKIRAGTRAGLEQLARGHASPGAALVRFGLGRIEDFQSNLLSQRYLPPEERETYVRNNVRSLVHDMPREALFERLARYAYEFQYLRFSGVPDAREFFLRSTWFAEQYLEPGIVDEAGFDRLFALMGRICDTYEVDESAFRG